MLGDRLFQVTPDAHVIALDMRTGALLWKATMADYKVGYSATVAAIVVKDKVIVGTAGAEFGTRGMIDAYDTQTGKRVWRFYTVAGPDDPVGGKTWPAGTPSYERGGGSIWTAGTYDPEQNLVFIGTGNPGPDYFASNREGDNLYTCSLVALDADTGKIKWHYQFSPNNPFDYDAVAEMVLADMTIEGKPTKVLMDANRNGFFYVLDRTNGKLLAANPYVKVNWATGIDMKTGRPIETDVSKDAREGKKVTVQPSILGGKNWEPMSYNPQTGLAYANTLNIGGNYKAEPAVFKQGEWYLGMDLTDIWAWPDGPRGYLKAIDPMTGKAKWEVPSDIPRFSGVLSTAGGVVFSGDERLANVPTGGSLWVFAVKQ